MGTVVVDFDGVIHSYEHGWQDGTIYGEPMPGAANALRYLMTQHAVAVQTCRKPLSAVAEWITEHVGLPTVVDSGDFRFWTRDDRILVTGRKLPALIYIDDRAYRFEGWDQTLLDLPCLLNSIA